METNQFEFENDIKTVCVKANFPEGIKDAYLTLEKKVGNITERHVYGASEIIDGQLHYWACAEAFEDGEAGKLGLDEYTIPKGKYLYTVFKWQGHEHEISGVFTKLLYHPGVKRDSIGVEYY